MNEEKKADNSINDIYQTKEKISRIDNRIDIEKKKMKDLDEIEELFSSLTKNISKCVELLNKSVKGKTVNAKLNAIEENNKINFGKSMANIDIQREETKRNLIKLTEEKEEYQNEIKEKYNEELKKENEENKKEQQENLSEENKDDDKRD